MTEVRNPLLPCTSKLFFGAVAISVIFVLTLCLFFSPRWGSNDEVGMSMIAHGYGIAATGSPQILFSNIFWGYIVRSIPQFAGLTGYSIATMSVPVIVGAVIIYGLIRLRVGYIACLSAFALIIIRPVLFPQFTINAGLLMLGALICFHLYAQRNDNRTLAAGCLSALASYWVRGPEFFFVLMVATPMVPWRALLVRRTATLALLLVAAAIAASAVIDHQSYQGSDWKLFNDLNPVRARVTDYGAASILKQRSDVLDRHGYSKNDIDLIENWFFVDAHIADPQALRSMLTEIGPLHNQANSLSNVWIALKTLADTAFLPAVIAAVLLCILRRNLKTAVSWGMFLTAICVLGLLGRPGISYVYFPLICLLLVAPYFSRQVSAFADRLCTGIMVIAAVVNAGLFFSASKHHQSTAEKTRADLAGFPSYPVIIWGGMFPYEDVYPVLGASAAAISFQHYGLGSSTLAPFTVANAMEKAGLGMTRLLLQKSGVPIVANEGLYHMLDIYCKEHLHADLVELWTKQYGVVQLSQRRCDVRP